MPRGTASWNRPQGRAPSVVKVLLLGSRGQLGRAIIRANDRLAVPFELLTLNRQQLDLSLTDEIQPTLNDIAFDFLVNCTGYNDVDGAETDPSMAFTVNGSAIAELAQACAAGKARLIHFSTDFVFGGIAGQRKPITENSRASPINVYGHSKLTGELAAPAYLREFVVMRVATLFGVGGMSRTGTNFVETVLRKAAEGNGFPVVDDQTMSPTSAGDVAEVVLTVLRNGCEPSIYHAVNTGEVTRYGFAREILRQAGLPAGIVRPCTSDEFPTAAKRPTYSALENRKLRSVVIGGMRSWQEALGAYLRAREEA